MKRISVSLAVLSLVLALGAAAQDRLAVSVEPNWKMHKQNCLDWGLEGYDIGLKCYFDTDLIGGETTEAGKGWSLRLVTSGKEPGARVREFISDLGKAKLLSIGSHVSDSFYLVPECREAVDAFLANGGVIIYHYNSNPANIPFANDLGKQPKLLEPGATIQCEIAAESKSPVLQVPNRLDKFKSKLTGTSAWAKWSDRQQTLIHKKGDPEEALLLLFEGVCGKGSVIINRVSGIGTPNTGRSEFTEALIENMMRHAWGVLD